VLHRTINANKNKDHNDISIEKIERINFSSSTSSDEQDSILHKDKGSLCKVKSLNDTTEKRKPINELRRKNYQDQ
jgi:hypothetical protein